MGEPIIKRVNEFDAILGTEIEDTDLLYLVKPTATLPEDIDRKLTATELIEYLNTKVSGGGGSGSGLDTLAVANELERTTGASVSLPNDKVNRDVFQNDDPVFCYLRESYVNTQGNTIKFDHGLLSETKIIDDMNATTGWSGTNCSIGVSPSIKVEGTNSVTMTLSSFSGTATAIKTFTAFSLNDLLMALSMRIGNIANLNDVSRLSVYLESSTNYSSEFYFDRASLGYVVDNFYRFTVPLNQTPDVVGSSGAAVLGSITKVAIKITTTNAISPIVYVDFITAISDKSFVAPTYSQTISIADGVNQESFTVISENTTSNITKGTFTFESLTQRLYFDIDFVTNNVISLKINDVAMTPVPFDTDNSTTYTNLANQILTEFPDTVLVATPDPSNRQIILTANDNGVKMVVSNISVIGGGVQATGQTQFCLANNYTNDSTVTYLSSNTGEASGGEFKQKTTVTGDNLKNAKYHSVVYAGKMLEKATFESFLNFNDDIFEVSDLSNLATTGEIVLKQRTDSSVEILRFKNNENFVLFKDVRVGKIQQSPRGTALSNFYLCKQSADGTNSGAYLTVTTDSYLTNYLTGEFTVGVPDLGADLSDYRVVPESAILQVVVGLKNASTITRAWPSELIVKQGISSFEDTFTRSNGVLGNDWSISVDATDNAGALTNWAIVSNTAQCSNSNNTHTLKMARNKEGYGKDKLPIEVSGSWYIVNSAAQATQLKISILTDTTPIGRVTSKSNWTQSKGISLLLAPQEYLAVYNNLIKIQQNGVTLASASSGFATSLTSIQSKKYYWKFRVEQNGDVKGKCWLSTNGEPDWQVTTNTTLVEYGKYLTITGAMENVTFYQVDDLVVSLGGVSYTLKYPISNIVNLDKLETITTNHRVDAVNQFPSILQKAEQVY